MKLFPLQFHLQYGSHVEWKVTSPGSCLTIAPDISVSACFEFYTVLRTMVRNKKQTLASHSLTRCSDTPCLHLSF